MGVEVLSPAVFALSRLDGGWGETTQKWAWTDPYLVELAARLEEVELEASNGEIDGNLPLGHHEGGRGRWFPGRGEDMGSVPVRGELESVFPHLT